MAIEDKVKRARRSKSERSADFVEQLDRGQAFTRKMQEMGLAQEERYEIPLMLRLGRAKFKLTESA